MPSWPAIALECPEQRVPAEHMTACSEVHKGRVFFSRDGQCGLVRWVDKMSEGSC